MILYDTKYLQLKSTKSKTGKDWIYAHRPNVSGGVVILPIINNDSVVFLIEERPPMAAENIAKYSISLPAGLVGDIRVDETIEDAVKTELLEETGLVADKIIIAADNVVVLGVLRGLAHAGARGNKKAIIAANRIECPQLRIANVVKEIEKEELEQEYKYASIDEENKIILE